MFESKPAALTKSLGGLQFFMKRKISIVPSFRKLGIRLEISETSLRVPPNQDLHVEDDLGGQIPKIEDGPWPAFPADLTSIALAVATQAFTRFLGAPSVSEETTNGTVRYRVAGLGVLELVTPHESASDPLHAALAARFRSKGDGIATLGIEVDDVRVRQRELEKVGIGFLMPEPCAAPSGAWNTPRSVTRPTPRPGSRR